MTLLKDFAQWFTEEKVYFFCSKTLLLLNIYMVYIENSSGVYILVRIGDKIIGKRYVPKDPPINVKSCFIKGLDLLTFFLSKFSS